MEGEKIGHQNQITMHKLVLGKYVATEIKETKVNINE